MDKKIAEEGEENDQIKAASAAGENGDNTQEFTRSKKGLLRILCLIPAVAAIITFFVTEDMRLPMQYVDKWTILMAIYAAVAVIFAVFSKKTKKDDDENEEEA